MHNSLNHGNNLHTHIGLIYTYIHTYMYIDIYGGGGGGDYLPPGFYQKWQIYQKFLRRRV